jgi:hypothetical protein
VALIGGEEGNAVNCGCLQYADSFEDTISLSAGVLVGRMIDCLHAALSLSLSLGYSSSFMAAQQHKKAASQPL